MVSFRCKFGGVCESFYVKIYREIMGVSPNVGVLLLLIAFCALVNPSKATSDNQRWSGSSSIPPAAVRNRNRLTPAHFEPQIATLCVDGQAYYPRYLNEHGRWETHADASDACPKDKVAILQLCKKVYPYHDITNIVEASKSARVSNWCRAGGVSKCKHTALVKPYRCLEGTFQSDALLVPESCLFDHVHNQTRCWEFARWNETAAQSCLERNLVLRSFSMLLPCGISLFAGVEFVCCPQRAETQNAVKKPLEGLALNKDDSGEGAFDASDDASDDDIDDEDALDDDEPDDTAPASTVGEYDNEYEDEEYDEDSGAGNGADDSTKGSASTTHSSSSSTTPSVASTTAPARATPTPTPDPYFTHFDPRVEHQAYKDAQQRLEEEHREKVTKVMKDWSDLEEHYQDMRTMDPKAAGDFKRRMTQSFQKTVQSLEEEGNAEKHQLYAMHQQRVLAHITQRKKDAMVSYTNALNENPPNTHRVQKCLQRLLRALHKDRHHCIARYRHLLMSNPEEAERQTSSALEHLTDIDRMLNQSMAMLDRYPNLKQKIGQLMEDYIQALRSKDDTPGSLLAMSRSAEAAILDKYRADVNAKLEERERQRALERQRKEQRKKERSELREEFREERLHVDVLGKTLDKDAKFKDIKFDPETMEDEHIGDLEREMTDGSATSANSGSSNNGSGTGSSSSSSIGASSASSVSGSSRDADQINSEPAPSSSVVPPVMPPVEHERDHDRSAHEFGVVSHKEDWPKVAHAQTHDISHSEATFLVRRELHHDNKSVYFTFSFVGIALMAAVIIGVAILRRRSARLPQNQGFVEVDQAATPEERHVANMQINGYENPTYKYFEVKE